MNIKNIISEAILEELLETITRRFSKAVEAYKKIQLKQQQLRKKFVSEKDPKKKEKLKNSLIKLHKEVQKAESDFNSALTSEPVDDLNESGKYRDVSDKFKNALDKLSDRNFTMKNIKALIKKTKQKRPDAAMAYAKDAFGWINGGKWLRESLDEADTFKAKSKKSGRVVVYKSKDALKNAIKSGTAEPLDKEKPEKDDGKVKGADLFKSKKSPSIDMDKVFNKGKVDRQQTTDEPFKPAPESVQLKKGLPSDLKQTMANIKSQDDLKKVFPKAELIQDTKSTHQFFKLGMESEGRGGKKYPIYAKAYINRKSGEIKMSNVYSGKRRDFGGGFTQGSDTIHQDADSVLKDKPKAEPRSKFGSKQKGIGAGEKNLKGPQSDKDAIGGSAEAEQKVLEKLRAIGPKDNVDLCTVSVPGTNMFCAGNIGIERADMPQLKSTVVPGGKADKLVKAGKLDADPKTGEVNTEGMFKSMLEKEGISMSEPTPEKVSKLKATQNQLEGSKVNMFAKVLAGEQPFPDKELPKEDLKKWQDALREPIIVSKGGYILDGHHRWAALVQHDVANGGGGDIEMDVKRVDMDAKALVDKTNKFTNAMGLAVKKKKPKKEGISEGKLTEGKWSVAYSDGMRAGKEFNSERQAMQYAKGLIKALKKLQFVSVHKPGMNSTADKGKLAAWWGDRSYWDNVSKKDKDVAKLKIEGKLNEDVWKSFLGDDSAFTLHTATNTEKRKTVKARKTDKVWDDGVPVLKYIARASKKDSPLPKGKFKIIHDKKYGWWYYQVGKTWYGIQTKDYGTPPFEY